jgi:hypothetical protein
MTAVQEAFRRALDDVKTRDAPRGTHRRNLRVVHAALRALDKGGPPAPLDRIIYTARKLARQWCSYTAPGERRPGRRAELRSTWASRASRLAQLDPEARARTLAEMAAAMGPDDPRHDWDRARYLLGQAAAHPEHFAGLTANPKLPWPGPAAFFVCALEELAAASPGERQELHTVMADQWDGQPAGLMQVLASWIARSAPGEPWRGDP